jgi:hypothetical protein
MGDASREAIDDCGSIEDMRPVNELRMKARWKLGRALAAVVLDTVEAAN